MSEQPNVPVQPDDEVERPPAGADDAAGQPGRVRTDGEIALDEALGTGDDVH